MGKIQRTSTFFPVARRRGVVSHIEGMAKGMGWTIRPGIGNPPAVAKINHGRWIADCPNCPAGTGAEFVDPNFDLFFCMSCGNVLVNERIRRVDFPPPPQVAEIEAILEPRPLKNQNWEPGETLEQLLAENQAGGI